MFMSRENKSLKPLPNDVRSVVRSGITINTVAQCVEELVYNSIDAGAKSVTIGVNLEQFNVRVDDDGDGVGEMDLEAVGTRYTTSKCNTLSDLNNLSFYGFRGEALASIIEVSNTVDIVTRPKTTLGIELRKKYENGQKKGFIEKYNTSNKKPGTSVTVGKLLSKLPVRQQRIDKSIQLEEVKNSLEKIAVINPALSLELRNEKNGILLFTFKSSSCYSDAINQIFMSQIGFEIQFVQEHFLHKTLFFNLSLCKDFVKKKLYQFVFVNNRFIRRCKIHKFIGNQILDKQNDSKKTDKYPIFILNITCPFSEYDITLEPKKQIVEFKNWDTVYSGIEGLILKLKHKNSLAICFNKTEILEKNVSRISSYDVKRALHSRFVGRDVDEHEPSVKSSCTGSDRGSLGESSLPKADTKAKIRQPNFIRTSHNTHVVNVREIRKKRKLGNIATAKPAPIPRKPKLSPAISKPRLTLGMFKKFPAWDGEFDKPVSAKRLKISHVDDCKCDEPDLYSNEQRKEVEQFNESTDYDWKLSRYFKSHHQAPDVAVDEDDAMIQSKDVTSRTSVPRLSLPDYSYPSDSVPFPKPHETPMPCEDLNEYVFEKSNEIIKNHFQGKWTLKNAKADILNRLFTYYKATKNKEMKTKPVTATLKEHKNRSHTQALSSPTPADPPAEDHRSSVTKAESISTSNGKDPGTQTFHPGIQISQQFPHLNMANSELPNNTCAPPLLNLFPFQKSFSTVWKETSNEKKPATQTFHPGIQTSSELPHPNTNISDLPNNKHAPPLLNLFPVQKSFSTEWKDEMISVNYIESDDDLFPSDWTAEVILDHQGQEWLKTIDGNKNLYINLSTGISCDDIAHVFGSSRKISADEMRKLNPSRYNWLRRHFPRGFKKFWNGDKREVVKNGDLNQLNFTVIGDSLLKCINQQQKNDYQLSKWTEKELQNVSKFFSGESESNIKTVNNVGATGIQCWKNLGGTTSSFRFSRDDFNFIKVIGQYDKKFILCGIRRSTTETETLVIFDQHAVHERIRLEELIADSLVKQSSVKYLKESEVMPPYQLSLSETEVRIMQNRTDFFKQAALHFEVVNFTSIKIKSVPKCFLEKCSNEPTVSRERTFRTLVHSLIQELVHTILETKVISLSSLPRTVHTILCSQACHGAIKFGDELDHKTCEQLIMKLKSCKNLFQCAHGRPSVVPLIKGKDMDKVSTAGNHCFEVRQLQATDVQSSCFPPHEQCSEYFCPGSTTGTSQYFDPSTVFDSSLKDTLVNNDNETSNTATGIHNSDFIESTTTNNFFSFLLGDNPVIEGCERSPYFLK